MNKARKPKQYSYTSSITENYLDFGNAIIVDSLYIYRKAKKSILRICSRIENGEWSPTWPDLILKHSSIMQYEKGFLFQHAYNYTTLDKKALVEYIKLALKEDE